ncbi:hypothetical protein [Dyadobacter sp. CY312]|uniref:hypothetical protein n=1 Tax=Dyadobacter sp. CY312 TaxID=2907303 RepID=UPI001F175A6F|nr:hypothetical protein [Dyadobacter sp. CY312]MCE7040444.1 hypothetical protein [Dyadobacter sp. CY312]
MDLDSEFLAELEGYQGNDFSKFDDDLTQKMMIDYVPQLVDLDSRKWRSFLFPIATYTPAKPQSAPGSGIEIINARSTKCYGMADGDTGHVYFDTGTDNQIRPDCGVIVRFHSSPEIRYVARFYIEMYSEKQYNFSLSGIRQQYTARQGPRKRIISVELTDNSLKRASLMQYLRDRASTRWYFYKVEICRIFLSPV